MIYKEEGICEKAFNLLNIIFCVILTCTMIYPMWNLLMISLSGAGPVLANRVKLVPIEFTLQTYKAIFSTNGMMKSMKNTVFITVVGTAFSMAMTALFAYPLSKSYIAAKNVILKLVVFTMLFGGGIIPEYILIKNLNLMNKFGALILPAAINTYNLIVMINFFRSVPKELEEAAIVDGMSDLQILIRVYIPLSLHAIATVSLFYAVAYWNIFYTALLYINDMKKYPLQLLLRQIIVSDLAMGQVDAVLDMPARNKISASIFFTIFPILCVYPFLQKYFVKGVMIGSIKG